MIALSNDSEYGLTSSIFTNDLNAALQASRELKFGETYDNREHFEAVQGFHAGCRKSGIGGADGKHGCTSSRRRSWSTSRDGDGPVLAVAGRALSGASWTYAMRLRDCHNFHDLRGLAKRCLPGPIFDCIDGGADHETTRRCNTDPFETCDLMPSVLRGVGEVDRS